MKSKLLTLGAAAFAAVLVFAPANVVQADGPNDMFQNEPGDDGNPDRDICGTTSVAAHANDASAGMSQVGENGEPQRFETAGRVNDPALDPGLGHVADDNCPLG